MKYRRLGSTDLNVSELCLGTMTWGKQNTQQDGFAQMDMAIEHGINFFDTAEMYAVPTTPETSGKTEEIIGNWFAARGGRDQIILASKAAGPGEWIKHIRGGPRLNRAHLFEAVENSLKRLQTDYLDLYQMHWPDRHTNYFGQLDYQHSDDEDFTPIDETIAALDELIAQGKIRHYGLSNETPWGAMKYCMEAGQRGMARPVSIQNPYSLLNRSYEVGLAEISHRENMGLLAYSPLAFGMLSGKYRHGQWPEKARLTIFKYFSRYTNPRATDATERYCQLAEQYDLSPTHMALQFVTQRSFVTSNIIGATTLEQLQENLNSINVTLSEELMHALDAVHNDIPNPAP